MGIYLLHAPVLVNVTSKIVKVFINDSLLAFLLALIVTCFASYWATRILSGFRFGRFIFGETSRG